MSRSRSGGSSGSRLGGGRSSLSGGRGRSMGGAPTARPTQAPRPTQPRNSGNMGAFGAGMMVGSGGRRGGMGMGRGFGPRRRMGRRMHGGGMHHSHGGGGSVFGTLVVVMILVIGFALLFNMMNNPTSNTNVPANTTNRDALELSIANQNAPVLIDHLGFVPNQAGLNNAVRSFHNATGIWVTLYITDNINGVYHPVTQVAPYVGDYTLNIFDTYLQSGANMLLFIYDDEVLSDWDVFTRVGNQATLVMDTEAEQILIAYLETHWFNESLTMSQVFERTLNDTASRIMSVDRPLWFYLALAAIPLGIVIIAFLAYNARNKRRREQEAHDERILAESQNVDLNIVDNELDAVLKQYEDK